MHLLLLSVTAAKSDLFKIMWNYCRLLNIVQLILQPMCDGSHKNVNNQSKPMFRSHKFEVSEEKEYALCNCKQTSTVPFCDGTHKQRWVHDALNWYLLYSCCCTRCGKI